MKELEDCRNEIKELKKLLAEAHQSIVEKQMIISLIIKEPSIPPELLSKILSIAKTWVAVPMQEIPDERSIYDQEEFESGSDDSYDQCPEKGCWADCAACDDDPDWYLYPEITDEQDRRDLFRELRDQRKQRQNIRKR